MRIKQDNMRVEIAETSTQVINNENIKDKKKSKKKLTKQQAENKLKYLDSYSKLLDAIPGLPIKIGLDGFIGLIPGAGDLITALISLFIFILADQLELPCYIKFKMTCNLFIDFIFGCIPILGDIFDVIFKANIRNCKIVKKYYDDNKNLYSDEV